MKFSMVSCILSNWDITSCTSKTKQCIGELKEFQVTYAVILPCPTKNETMSLRFS